MKSQSQESHLGSRQDRPSDAAIEASERLLEALRKELHECGAMLALLDQQQQAVMGRAGDDVLQSVAAVNAQTVLVEEARRLRDSRRSELAHLLGQPTDAPFTGLIPRVALKYRPAMEAVVRENNQLITRIRQRARQNHLLIARSLEMMQRVLNAFMPASQATTYTDTGKTSENGPAALKLYDAVG